jgi:hypothetical protein
MPFYTLNFAKILNKNLKSVSNLLITIFTILIATTNSIFALEWDWGLPTNLTQINSPKDDFAPCWNPFEKKLYFSSTRKTYSKFYISEFETNTIFSTPLELPDPLNKETKNVSYISFLSETEAILNAFRKGEVQSYLNIFSTQRRAGKWQKPLPLDSLQCECFVLHPTISPDGTFIVFSSNRDNTNNLDLYIAYRLENGIWGSIEKIDGLSTDGDEITPFLAANDTLYFASNGFGGPGGFDLFYSVRKGNNWGMPIPLSQLNTRFDESDFAIINDTLAVFATNRPDGLGGLDLYLAKRFTPRELVEESIPKLDISIAVQIPIVRVRREYAYELSIFPQTIPITFIENQSEIVGEFNEEDIHSIEQFQKNYLNILFSRILKHKAPVKIKFDTTNSIIYYRIKTILEKLKSTTYTFDSLVQIEHNPEQNFTIMSDDSSIFQPIKIGKFTELYEPPLLEVSFLARPAEILSFFEIVLRNTKLRRMGYSLPFTTTIELVQDSLVGTRNSDTLFIDAIAQDTVGRKFLTSYPIILNRSSVFYKNTIDFKGKKYERVYITELSTEIEKQIDFQQLMKELTQYTENIADIVVIGNKQITSISQSFCQNLLSKYFKIPANKINVFVSREEYENQFGKIPVGFAVLLISRK